MNHALAIELHIRFIKKEAQIVEVLYRESYPEPLEDIGFTPIGLDEPYRIVVGNNPVNWIDPWGLKTWMCEKPLDALGGEGTKSGPDMWGNPFYHQYICVGNEDSPICGGQSSGGKPYGPGKPSDDKYNPDRCKEKEPDNDCLEKCIQKKIQNPKRPYYGLIGPGTNCQEWADETLAKCRKECKKEK